MNVTPIHAILQQFATIHLEVIPANVLKILLEMHTLILAAMLQMIVTTAIKTVHTQAHVFKLVEFQNAVIVVMIQPFAV